MANKINVKLILQLRDEGLGRNAIAFSRHIGKSSVSDVFAIADKMGIKYSDVMNMDSNDVYKLFFPNKYTSEIPYAEPNYDNAHNELSKTGVTLKLLWEEYVDDCKKNSTIPCGYSVFCKGYKNYVVSQSITNRIEHKPGLAVEVDWSGPTMEYVDRFTGEVHKAYLFVATLPYSQYTYVEACEDMKQNTWLKCHINMYKFFEGVPTKTVCDNLKTGVISHPKEGDIILNEAYESLGNHYLTAIMPTGVRKPKQKASVEGAVGKIATAIIAKLRNNTYHSISEIQLDVFEKLFDFNHANFQKRKYSRYEVYLEEKEYLKPLPSIPYEIAEWVYGRSVGLDCHVIYQKNRYSCPYQYVGTKVDLKITDRTLEIFYQNERLATHSRFPEYVSNKYSTHPEDMPDQFQKMDWNYDRIINWSKEIGPNTETVINRIFDTVKIKEQGFNSSLSVLKLGKSYSNERLENACGVALTIVRVPRYHHIKAVLNSNQDKLQKEHKTLPNAESEPIGYVRGAAYYGGGHND